MKDNNYDIQEQQYYSSELSNEELMMMKGNNKVHIPFCDVDDLAFKNRHDPNFIASITNLMQVPSKLTVSNNNNNSNNNGTQLPNNMFADNIHFQMDVPEKLTVFTDGIVKSRQDLDRHHQAYNDFSIEDSKDSDTHNTTVTPPSTPTKMTYLDSNFEDELKLSKTPQIAADLFNRMRPRRSSLEVDLHTEIRMLRDKINNLEHECQVNTRSCKIFYAVICGYVVLKTFSWLLNSK